MEHTTESTSINNLIENKIKFGKKYLSTNTIANNDENNLDNDLEMELEKNCKYSNPKNYGNLWSDDERKIILSCLKKNKEQDNSNIYNEHVIKKIAKKTERSEFGVKEEIKKMIFNDYMGDFNSLDQLSLKYNIPERNIKILIKLYLEKYGEKMLYPMEIENKILKYKVENLKLKKELRELMNNLK